MHRDLNDIIPPSRRKALDLGRATSDPVSPLPASVTKETQSVSMSDMKSSKQPEERAPEVTRYVAEAVPPMPRAPKKRIGRGGFPFGTALIALVVIALCGGVLYAFAGAKVTVTPVANVATVAGDMSATLGSGDLPFQVISVSKTVTANVPAESTQTSNDPATGKITISNKQATSQALIKNTRFQSPQGLVYRIHDSISIPSGGSVTATVYADEAGDKYNLAPTTFTIPGLKGSKAYDLVTAKSDAPFVGGFTGTRPTVSQATKDKQYADMQSKMVADIEKDLTAKIPQGYVLVPGASYTTYEPQPDTAGASGTVTLSDKGTITAVVFPVDALARAIAFRSVGTYAGQPVTLASVQNLVAKPAQASIAPDATTFDFTLTGTTTVVWQVDPAKIAGAVAGKTRSSAEIALKSFPEVDKATLVLRPFWASKFPGDPAKIKVTVSEPGASK